MNTTSTRWSRHWERWQVLQDGGSPDPLAAAAAVPPNPAADLEAHHQQVIDRLKSVSNVASAAGITSWEFDLKVNCFTWSSTRQRCFGLDHVPLTEYLEALTGITLEEDRHIVSGAAVRALAEGTDTYSYQFRVRGKDGGVHHMRNVCKLQRNARGKYRYIMGVTIDITQEVRASALLAERAEENRRLLERLSMAAESANIGSWELDLVAQRFSSVDFAIKAQGLTSEEFGSLDDYAKRVLPEDQQVFPDAIKRCITDGTLRFAIRYGVIAPAGNVVYVRSCGRVLLNQQGRPVRASGVAWDATEEVLTQRRLQAQMQQARELSERLAVATMAAGVATFELDLVAARVLWSENSLPVWQGVIPEDGHLRAFVTHLHPDDRYALAEAIKVALEQGTDVIQYTYRLAKGEEQWAHVRVYAKIYLNEQRRAVRALGAAWDITQEVAAKQEENRRAEHERALLHRLSVVTQAAQIILWEFDLQTRSYHRLGGGFAVFGAGPAESENVVDAVEKLMVPEDRGRMQRATAEAIAAGVEDYTCAYRIKTPEGRVHHMKNFARILRTAEGRPHRIIGVTWDHSQDVAEGVRLQSQVAAARELSERLTLATRAAGVAIWEIDLVDMRFAWYENALPTTAAGHNANDDLREYSRHVHPEDSQVMVNAIKTAVQEGNDLIRYIYRMYTATGELAHIRNDAKLYFNAERRAVRMVGVSSASPRRCWPPRNNASRLSRNARCCCGST